MGIDFDKPSNMFQVIDNTKYQICSTYPKYIIGPKVISLE